MFSFKKLQFEILTRLAATLLKLIAVTTRKCIVDQHGQALEQMPTGPYILLFWHDQQIPHSWIVKFLKRGTKSRKIFALSSQHKDGRVAAAIVSRFDIATVSGSSTRGGLEALFELKRSLNGTNHVAALTPDGPRGPKHIAKRGSIKLAALTQVPIYCSAIQVSSAWHFNSWDRIILPKPFSKITFNIQKFPCIPLKLSKAEEEVMTGQLTELLNTLTK